jgi:predicted  nucleic acid-binding Zn-ribbon protein
MKQKIRTLVRLQMVEMEIRALEQALALAPGRFEELTAERQALADAVQAAEARVDDLKKRYREAERQAREQQDRAVKRTARLNEVKTNKEYQATLKEIDDIRAGVSAIEDEMIGMLEMIEAAEAQLAQTKDTFARRKEDLAREAAGVEQAMAEDRQRIEAARADREQLSGQVAPEFMSIYLKARAQQRDAMAVAGVLNGVCQGCHMNIPPQLYNELQRQDDLKICPLCQRIIFWQTEES